MTTNKADFEDDNGIVRLWNWGKPNTEIPLTNATMRVAHPAVDVVEFYTHLFTFNRYAPPRSCDVSYDAGRCARFTFEAEQECRLEFGLPLLRDKDSELRQAEYQRVLAEDLQLEKTARRHGFKSAQDEDNFLEAVEFDELCEHSLER